MRRQCVRKRDNDERTMIIQICFFVHQTKVRDMEAERGNNKWLALRKVLAKKNSHAVEVERRTEKCHVSRTKFICCTFLYSANDTYYENLRLKQSERERERQRRERSMIVVSLNQFHYLLRLNLLV
jgi:hypothetical protein